MWAKSQVAAGALMSRDMQLFPEDAIENEAVKEALRVCFRVRRSDAVHGVHVEPLLHDGTCLGT